MGPEYATLMSYAEYVRSDVPAPFVLELEARKGKLCYYGVLSSLDPSHPQFREIETKWDSLGTTIAFNMGTVDLTSETREEAIEKYGGGGLVQFLANRDNIKVLSLEPQAGDEVVILLDQFSPEQIKLYNILKLIARHRRMKVDERELDELVQSSLDALSETPGLEVTPNTLQELDGSIERLLPTMDNWRRITRAWVSPLDSLAFTNEIARTSVSFRGWYMLRLLIHALNDGHHVFAVAEMSNVVMQEPVLRAKFEE